MAPAALLAAAAGLGSAATALSARRSAVTGPSPRIAAAAPVLGGRRAVRRAVATADVASQPVLAEAEDLKARFTALQEEVVSYRTLNSENARLEEAVERLVKENQELADKLAAAQVEASQKLALAQKAAAAQVAAAKMEVVSKADEVERNLEDLRQQLRTSQKEREQVLFVMSNAARRLGELLYPTGSLPAGLSINTTLMGLQGPVAGVPPPPAAPKPSAAPSALAWVASAAKALVFYALGGAGLYYAASILRAAPPVVTLEFALGCVALCWALPTLKAMLTQQAPTSTA